MMIKKEYWTALPVVGCMVMLAGCNKVIEAFAYPSIADVKDFARLEAERLEDHDTNMTEQHKKMHPDAATEIDKLKAEFDAKLQANVKKTQAIEGTVTGIIKDAAARFAGLPAGGSVEGFVSKLVGTETDKVRAKTEEVRTAMLVNFKDVNEDIVDESKARVAEIVKMERDLKARLDQLTEETRTKLASTTKETFNKLEGLKDDRAAFERTLRDELKLTPAQIEELKGMTTEQILALIAAAGGAAGIGVAGSRGGKSRSHAEIERLKDSVSRLTANIERAKPPLT